MRQPPNTLTLTSPFLCSPCSGLSACARPSESTLASLASPHQPHSQYEVCGRRPRLAASPRSAAPLRNARPRPFRSSLLSTLRRSCAICGQTFLWQATRQSCGKRSGCSTARALASRCARTFGRCSRSVGATNFCARFRPKVSSHPWKRRIDTTLCSML